MIPVKPKGWWALPSCFFCGVEPGQFPTCPPWVCSAGKGTTSPRVMILCPGPACAAATLQTVAWLRVFQERQTESRVWGGMWRVLTGGGVDPHGQLLICAGLEEAFCHWFLPMHWLYSYLNHPLMDAVEALLPVTVNFVPSTKWVCLRPGLKYFLLSFLCVCACVACLHVRHHTCVGVCACRCMYTWRLIAGHHPLCV